MNQFLFPANPADGDVVVRMVDGTQIKGTYNATTNTWEVGELPEEPGVPGPQGPKGEQGEKGDPGQGLQVSGSVATENDLPTPNNHYLQFWVTDDTNTLYYSDGNTWTNLGSPIQGPQGDGLTSVVANDDGVVYTITFDGTLPQFNFTTPNLKGSNGAPGKGWYDTTIIDERPSSYKINFQSNDGLGFVTDNIMGPKGEAGSLQVATADTIGGIKIGRGLDIAPDGTANAGITNVNLETTPVQPGSLAVGYAPIYNFLGEYKEDKWIGPRNDYVFSEDEVTIEMPARANGASIYMFASTTMRGNPDLNDYTENNTRAFRLYATNALFLTNAIFQSGRTDAISMAHTHNLCYLINSASLLARVDTKPITKINQIEFEPGATVTFRYRNRIERSGSNLYGGGGMNLVVVPFRDIDEDSDTVRDLTPQDVVVREGDVTFFNADNEPDDLVPPITEEQEQAEAAEEMKATIRATMEAINDELIYQQGTQTGTQLIEYRNQLREARDLPGTYEEIYAYIQPIVNAANALVRYKFRFEVI